MRVLQMISSLKIGGAQKLQETLAGATTARPVEMVVASLRDDAGSPILAALRAHGRRVEHFPAGKLFSPGRLQRLIKFVRAEKFDVIQSHLTYANILAALVGRLTGVPVVGTLHNVKIEAKHYNPLREGMLETLALRYGARAVVAVGQGVADANRPNLGRQRLVIIPNAVPLSTPMPEAARTELRCAITGDAARPLVLSVGRLSVQKGFGDLLTAFAQTRIAHPSAFLAVAGSGELREALNEQLTALGLTGHAALLGARNDVPHLLAAADVFVSSSWWEGLPVAVLEALAAGLPVIATRVGDVPLVMVEGTGLLTDAKAPDQLARALNTLLSDAPQRHALGQRARQHMQDHYSPEAWLEQHLQLYQSLLAP